VVECSADCRQGGYWSLGESAFACFYLARPLPVAYKLIDVFFYGRKKTLTVDKYNGYGCKLVEVITLKKKFSHSF